MSERRAAIRASAKLGRSNPSCSIDELRAAARTIIFERLRANDPLAARVGRSMERSLSGLNALDITAAAALSLHQDALKRLDDNRTADITVRMEIVAGLERRLAAAALSA